MTPISAVQRMVALVSGARWDRERVGRSGPRGGARSFALAVLAGMLAVIAPVVAALSVQLAGAVAAQAAPASAPASSPGAVVAPGGHGAPAALHTPLSGVHLSPKITVGNSNCGTLTATPDSGVTGGYTYNGSTTPASTINFAMTWNGSPNTTGCKTNPADCAVILGGCHAGYWLVGLFCSTLAQTSSNPQQYCDLNHGVVLTDYNSGPNDSPDNHGSSWNQCTTVSTLSGIISSGTTVPKCLADGNGHAPGWSENWPAGHSSGTFSTPMPESGSNTPFSPASPSTDCPPSQAEIAAGAIPGMCVFAVEEIDWYYYCIGACLPDFGNLAYSYPNGENINAANFMATTFSYQQTAPGPTSTVVDGHRPVPGTTFTLNGSGWGPAVGLSTSSGSLTAKVCGLGGVAAACSADSTVSVTEASDGSGTLTGSGTLGSDVGTSCIEGTCFVQLETTGTQVENGWIGPQTFQSAPLEVPPGYWTVASDGGVFTFGHKTFYGSTGNLKLNKPIVGMAATPDDRGYWLVASDGGIFSFGDATFYGSTGKLTLNKPIVGMSPTPDGKGYWLVASDGGIFAFGDATYYGSTGKLTLNKPIVGMSATADGKGYWLVATDGGIFAFGDAHFYGSTGKLTLNKPIVGMAITPSGNGYWLDASDGGIFAFGDAAFWGSMGGHRLNQPMDGMTD